MAGGGPLLPRSEHGPTVPGKWGDAIKHFTRHQFVQIRTGPSICSDSGEECSADRGFRHWFLDPEAGEMHFRVWCDPPLFVSGGHGFRPRRRRRRSFGGGYRGARVAARGGDGRRRLRLNDQCVNTPACTALTLTMMLCLSACVFWGVSVQRLVQRRLRQLATTSRCAYLFFIIVCFLKDLQPITGSLLAKSCSLMSFDRWPTNTCRDLRSQ